MKSFFKKIFIVFLFFAGITPVIFSAFFLLKQQLIRNEMLEKLEESHMQIIHVNAKDLNWIKKNKEINVDGKMFDVKYFSIENNIYSLTGLFDEEESALNKLLEDDFNQENKSGNRILAQLFQLLQSFYPGIDLNALLIRIFEGEKNTYPSMHISTGFKNILSPPPKY